MWLAIVCCLVLSNAATLWWALTKRLGVSKQVRALQRAVASFQSEGYALLEIRRINPDNIFYQNPERQG